MDEAKDSGGVEFEEVEPNTEAHRLHQLADELRAALESEDGHGGALADVASRYRRCFDSADALDALNEALAATDDPEDRLDHAKHADLLVRLAFQAARPSTPFAFRPADDCADDPRPAPVVRRAGLEGVGESVYAAGDVNMLSGPSNAGKSSWARSAAVVASPPLSEVHDRFRSGDALVDPLMAGTGMGLTIRSGLVLLVSYEDRPSKIGAAMWSTARALLPPSATDADVLLAVRNLRVLYPADHGGGPLFEPPQEQGVRLTNTLAAPTTTYRAMWDLVDQLHAHPPDGHLAPTMVVIDSFARALSADMNSAHAVTPFLTALASEAVQRNVAVVLLGHSNKQGARTRTPDGKRLSPDTADLHDGTYQKLAQCRGSMSLLKAGDDGRQAVLTCDNSNDGAVGWKVRLVSATDQGPLVWREETDDEGQERRAAVAAEPSRKRAAIDLQLHFTAWINAQEPAERGRMAAHYNIVRRAEGLPPVTVDKIGRSLLAGAGWEVWKRRDKDARDERWWRPVP